MVLRMHALWEVEKVDYVSGLLAEQVHARAYSHSRVIKIEICDWYMHFILGMRDKGYHHGD